MEARFWHQKWDDGKIGFHQSDVNKRLVKFWPQVISAGLQSDEPSCVFVPLCGKSLDLLWLHQQGQQVLGIELSEKAVRAFFEENRLPCAKDTIGAYTRFSGEDEAEGITVLVGDFFALTPDHVKHCNAFYDRASMIAMSPVMRKAYADQMATLMTPHSAGLLLAISYDQSRMKGPPFSVSDENVHSLLAVNFDIAELAHYGGPNQVGDLADRGLETLDERVYLLKCKL